MGWRRRRYLAIHPFRLATAIIVGIVITVAVAWGFAARFPRHARPPILTQDISWWLLLGGVDTSGADAIFLWSDQAEPARFYARWIHEPGIAAGEWTTSHHQPIWFSVPGKSTLFAHPPTELVDSRPAWLLHEDDPFARSAGPGHMLSSAYGWPCLALAGHVCLDYPPASHGWVRIPVSIVRRFHVAQSYPVLPQFPGFVLNTLVYTVAVYAALSLPTCITALRRRLTNRCRACGYSLEGLAADACPECGRTIKRLSPPSST